MMTNKTSNRWAFWAALLMAYGAGLIGRPVTAAPNEEPLLWDTVTSSPYMFDEFFEPQGVCVALAVSNHGEMGWLGNGTVNLDYTVSGLECGTRAADRIYLKSGSPFVILADASDGTNARLTCSYMDADLADPNGWRPTAARGTICGGTPYLADYDSVYTGQFVNRDTTIAMERTYYAPRSSNPQSATLNFVICATKLYSADGRSHNHLTVGNVIDWNVPSDRVNQNTNGVSPNLSFVYIQGTDTAGSSSCQLSTRRFAAEVFGGGMTRGPISGIPDPIDPTYYGTNAFDQHLLLDTTHYRDGTPLIPNQPNPLVWWEETSVPGLNVNEYAQDQAVWMTYLQDYSLEASDVLYFWTVLATVRDGTVDELGEVVSTAKHWYNTTVLDNWTGCCRGCVGRVGDANGAGQDTPTIGDVSVIIDAKFITGECICEGPGTNIVCLTEADINQSGGNNPTCDDITIGDISMLIDCLFITGLEDCLLPQCLWPGWPIAGTKSAHP